MATLNREAIKRRREELTLTMEEAARRAGMISRQKWNSFENAPEDYAPRLDTLGAVALALQCSISDLVTEKYPPGRKSRS